jgi:tetratricopeptide (TPR) repeat protein
LTSGKEGRLNRDFRKALCGFARHIVLAEPQLALPAAQLIREHRYELEYLADMIRFHLEQCEQQENEWNRDNKFYWRFETRQESVPPDVEEEVAELYHRGEHERAVAIFRLLVDCFDAYAEGHNYLGLIALKRNRLEEAIDCFTRTMEVGRKLFPKRISRKRYWTDLSTRPYMRGMQNLAHALNRAGRYDESLALCDRLEQECGGKETAEAHRAAVYLNLGDWQKAEQSAHFLPRIFPEESLLRSFALFELGLQQEATAAFLHGALNHPRAARMLSGVRCEPPKFQSEIEDYNLGIELSRSLHGYLDCRSPRTRQFFRQLVEHPSVVALLEEVLEVEYQWREERRADDRKAYNRMQQMRSPEFAQDKANELAWLLEPRH